MLAEKPSQSLQENVLCLLCHNDEHGKIIANLVESELFEGDLRVIAERAIDYWRQQSEAPKIHTPDLVSDIIYDPNNRRAETYRSILRAMIELHEGINTKYIMESLRAFKRTQRLKQTILRSAEMINNQQEMGIAGIEDLWSDLLRSREIDFSPGLRLDSYDKVVSYFEQAHVEFRTGIKELNSRHIVPARGEVLLFLASAGRGKSWWLVDLGKRALQFRKKVVHITLEMSEEEVVQRYYQSEFAVPKRISEAKVTEFIIKDGRLSGFSITDSTSEFQLNSPFIREELKSRISHTGTKFANAVVKRFPGRSLTSNGLRAYLDQLEIVEKFIPDLLILDYIGIMHSDLKNYRISMGSNLVEFRAICVERNLAGATAHQLSKDGEKAHSTRSTHIAEDWSMIGTADNVITYSQTEGERKFGLARLHVSKARTEETGSTILITQNYVNGQFCLSSISMNSKYETMVEDFTKKDDEEDASDNEEYE